MRERKSRTVIIGIDGVPFELMDKLSRKGAMPNFRELRKDGVFRKMESSIPEISSVSWSSVITGKNPGEHGIFGFTDMIEGTYTLRFPDFRDLKAKTFWHMNPKKRYVIMNVPSTYPAKELNGFLVSGFVSIDMEGAVYPSVHIPRLKKMDYRIDVDSEKGHKSKTLFLNDLFYTLERRIETYRHFWRSLKWDVFMLVFTGSDRLGHFLWDAYKNPNHEHHEGFLEFFRKIDQVIGEINGKLSPEDNLLMLSDHGMEAIEENVYVNSLLSDEGLLILGEDKDKRYNNIKYGSKAFALDPGRIYLNREGKYPNGSVKKSEENKLIRQLTELFEGLEKDGRKVIKSVFRKDEIYMGSQIHNSPDLILLANKGFNLKGSLRKHKLFGKDIFTGMHSHGNAFLFIRNRENEPFVPKKPRVSDFLNVMEAVSK